MVGADDALGQVIWAAYFIEGHGYTMKHSTIYQANISTMLLETNDWGSNGKITKNVEAIYYIKDSVDRGDLKI